MTMLFYRQAAGDIAPMPVELGDLELVKWQPARDGAPRGVFATRTNRLWWLLHRLAAFARPDLTAYALLDGGRVVHRLLVTPRWFRFPDMDADDLQMGDLWTDPTRRGEGLAARMIAAVHADRAGRFGAMWYLVDSDNAASVRLIERFGYRLAGEGVRTRPLGIGALGRFRMLSRRGVG